MSGPLSPAAAPARARPCRVMLADDSAVVRGFFRRALECDPEIDVVASVGDGQAAIDALKQSPVHVIVLDIEMPVMDGMTALPKLLEIDPDVRIVMVSTLTPANAAIGMKALALGATDCIAKPTTGAEIHSAEMFARDLRETVKALGFARRGAAAAPAASPRGGTVTLRRAAAASARAVAIGSSTGGPQALLSIVSGLGADFTTPVLITQHMPATFTGILAAHLAKVSGRAAAEGRDGEPVLPGRIYVAPGDWHMTVERAAPDPVIRLLRTPPENFCRPAVDVMLRSMARVYRDRLLTVILTGMGHDGLDGGRRVVEAGGTVIAQDEPTSVVWGMPRAVAAAGLCSAVLPIDDIAGRIRALAGRVAA